MAKYGYCTHDPGHGSSFNTLPAIALSTWSRFSTDQTSDFGFGWVDAGLELHEVGAKSSECYA